MEAFTYRDGQLHAEDVPVARLADEHGTPLFIYSRTHLEEQYRALAAAMQAVSPLICFSVKVNTNGAVIRTLADLGAGADAVSGGELFRARRAGVPASRIVFAGVGKTAAEIEYALKEDILFFTVESEAELQRIAECSARLGRGARVALRVNPDVDPRTHRYISTGKKENKFGLDLDRAERAYEQAARLGNIQIVGVHMHIGSQILSAEPYGESLEKIGGLCRRLKDRYPSFKYVDLGGGLGIQYKYQERPLDPRMFANVVVPHLQDLGLSVVLEPGRYLAGNAGILVTRVQYVKENTIKRFIIVDAAMNDLIRPPLYQAHHEIVPVRETSGTAQGDVVGPICESTDFFAMDRDLPRAQAGDLLAIRGAGAYAFAMASNYNSRPRAAEVMVWRDQSAVIRGRESNEDLVRGEVMPSW